MPNDRRKDALEYRIEAANTAFHRPHPEHLANGDEERYRNERYAMSFTKGLDHDLETGLLKEATHFNAFRRAIDEGYVGAFNAGVPVPTSDTDPATGQFTGETRDRRLWEAPTAGVVFELEGPDPQAVTMAPAPTLGSPELALEMAEVYELALLRDVPLSEFADSAAEKAVREKRGAPYATSTLPDLQFKSDAKGTPVGDALFRLSEFREKVGKGPFLDDLRPRLKNAVHHLVTAQELFRGSSPGNEVGPYLSQFLLIGTWDQSTPPEIIDGRAGSPEATLSARGQITYGSIQIDQRILVAEPNRDFMQTTKTWFDVQQGFQPTLERQLYSPDEGAGATEGFAARRFLSTPRDLATYVHFDALYEAYLNACLILWQQQAPLDPAFDQLSGHGRYHSLAGGLAGTTRNAGGFALFGGPHVLTLVTEVATRALKAVRFQKFNNHIRLRPETLAGRLALADAIKKPFPNLGESFEAMKHLMSKTVDAIVAHNRGGDGGKGKGARPFLPMAFAEGSPMHPAYGAGHATVAGACVTVLKAFFDTDAVFVRPQGKGEPRFKRYEGKCTIAGKEREADVPVAFVSDYAYQDDNGTPLEGHGLVSLDCVQPLTLEGELNKLAANISIGRNMAGVHYYSDYFDSVRMGEEIAIAMLEEQALGYKTDPFVMSVPTFDGGVRRIGRR
ncbi:MAG: bromoperoxidase [Myxococcota bacterium]